MAVVTCKYCGKKFNREKESYIQIPAGTRFRYGHSQCYLDAVNNGKEFVFINVHFSAYDSSGSVRRQQLGLVNQVFQEETSKGNYVMLGADWNQILPQTYGYSGSDTKFKNEIIYDNNDPAIAPFPFKEFKWGKCDPSKPTNDLCWKDYPTYEKNKSYKKGLHKLYR